VDLYPLVFGVPAEVLEEAEVLEVADLVKFPELGTSS